MNMLAAADDPVDVLMRDNTYAVEVLSCISTIEALEPFARDLVSVDGIRISPAFFVASLWDHWTPKVVVLRHDDHVCAVVYAKERKVFGIPTGIIYVDSGIGDTVFTKNRDHVSVLLKAIKTLLSVRRVRGIRLTLPAEHPMLSELRDRVGHLGLDYDETGAMRHRVLPLGSTYESFLKNIGAKTRRHIRYYRRRFEADGNVYVEHLPLIDFLQAASTLMLDEVVGADRDLLPRAGGLIASAEKPLLAGLQSKSGEWLSVLGGWHDGGRAVVFMQVNSDKRHPQYSLSAVMRSYLVGSLIDRGINELVFWGGLEGPLKPHTRPIAATYVFLDKRDLAWTAFRRVAKQLGCCLPRCIGEWCCWVVPSPIQPI
jgi:hypothetical protein